MQYKNLLKEIEKLHENVIQQTARKINHFLVIRNWLVGRYIVEYEQNGQDRAKYGKQLLTKLADDLTKKIGKGFYLAQKINETELYLVKDKRKRKKWQKSLDEINKKFKCNDRCMTDKEIEEYEEGWKLFKKYYFDLWD